MHILMALKLNRKKKMFKHRTRGKTVFQIFGANF